MEQRVVGVPMVVAPRELVQVALKPLVRDLLVVPSYTGLEVPEESLNGVGVRVASHVGTGGVVDPTMGDEVPVEAVVGRPFVGDDDRLGLNPLDDLFFERRSAPGLKDGRLDPSAAFYGSEHRCSTTFPDFRGLRALTRIGDPLTLRPFRATIDRCLVD